MASNKHGKTNNNSEEVSQRKSVSILDQKKILDLLDKGVTYREIMKMTGVKISAISGIKRRRKYIEKYVSSVGSKGDLSSRKRIKTPRHPDVDRALYLWYLEQRKKYIKVTNTTLREKAKGFHNELCMDDSCTFIVSVKWVLGFKKRHAFDSINDTNDDFPVEKDSSTSPTPIKSEELIIPNEEMPMDDSQMGNFDFCGVPGGVTKDNMMSEKPRQRRSFTIMDQKRILELIDKGVSYRNIKKLTGISTSSISGIRGRRDLIEKYITSDKSRDLASRHRIRKVTHPAVERSLYLWYRENHSPESPITNTKIQEQARIFHKQLCFDEKCPFAAGYNYISAFRKRHGFQNTKEPENDKSNNNFGTVVDFNSEIKQEEEEMDLVSDEIWVSSLQVNDKNINEMNRTQEAIFNLDNLIEYYNDNSETQTYLYHLKDDLEAKLQGLFDM